MQERRPRTTRPPAAPRPPHTSASGASRADRRRKRWLGLPRSFWGRLSLAFAAVGIAFLALSLRSSSGPGVWLSPLGGASDSYVSGAIAGHDPVEDDGIINSIEELHQVFGEPPDATFGRMRIPAIGVDAPLGARYVSDDGVMLNPSGPDDVVYYDFSGWSGYGGYPTAGGNAVFAGHVDRAAYLDYAGVEYIGPAVFIALNQLGGGEVIEIDLGTGPVTYVVEWVREVAVGDDWRPILTSQVEVDSITLITCGGDFNSVERAYTHRTVVRAVRA